jgi:hypothetical protein
LSSTAGTAKDASREAEFYWLVCRRLDLKAWNSDVELRPCRNIVKS